MKNITFLFVSAFIFFSLLSETNAQELPLNYQYMLNGYLLNPALVVTNPGGVRVSARQQWVGIEGAPRTIVGSGNYRFGKFRNSTTKNNGIGAYIYNDKNGAVNRFGFQVSYAHNVELNRTFNLAMGLSFSGYQFSLDQRGLTTHTSGDPAITGTVSDVYSIPEANAGAILYTSTTFFAISATQLLGSKVRLNGDVYTENTYPRSIFLTMGYKNFVIENIQFEPSFVMRLAKAQPIEYHLNTKLYFGDVVWLGSSFRINDSFMMLFGFNLQEYFFGYAYQYSFGGINNYNHGSHEFMVGISFEKVRTRGRGAVKCPAFN